MCRILWFRFITSFTDFLSSNALNSKISPLIYKSINHLESAYLSELISSHPSARTLRCSSRSSLTIPPNTSLRWLCIFGVGPETAWEFSKKAQNILVCVCVCVYVCVSIRVRLCVYSALSDCWLDLTLYKTHIIIIIIIISAQLIAQRCRGSFEGILFLYWPQRFVNILMIN